MIVTVELERDSWDAISAVRVVDEEEEHVGVDRDQGEVRRTGTLHALAQRALAEEKGHQARENRERNT